jgi:hypothetical protein
MPGRHQIAPTRRRPWGWLAGLGAASILAAIGLALFPTSAGADTTVGAQLSLTGVATKSNVAGGSEIGIHPGDSVRFQAAAVPTAGLENIPALGSLLNNLLGPLSSQIYQVDLTFPAGFPGGADTVTLGGPTSGPCKAEPPRTVRFPNKGSFDFSWKVKYVAPLIGWCDEHSLNNAQLNQLKSAGVALNLSTGWNGRIVVADNPPKGGISVQLPGVTAAPSIAGHQLPTVGVPGANLPTLTAPSLNVPGLPGSGKSTTPPRGGTTTTPPANPTSTAGDELPVPARVVPSGQGDAVFGNVGGGYLPDALSGASKLAGGLNGSAPVAAAASSSAAPVQQNSTGKHKTIDLAAGKADSTGQFSVILAIVAIVALSVVAATYARLYLLRRESAAE